MSTIERLRPDVAPLGLRGGLVLLLLLAWTFLSRLVDLARPGSLAFDETYYAKDAWSLTTSGYERTWAKDADARVLRGDLTAMNADGSFVVHPPMGKYLIGLSEHVFGLTPFGWRFASVVAGTVLVLAVFLLTRRLSRSTLVGALAGLLLSLDGLHFVMSRLALLDVFEAMFTLLAVAAVVADRDFFRARLADHLERAGLADLGGHLGPRVWWRPWRLLAGVLFGCAIATKWSALYPLAAFCVLALLWDVGARRLAGAGRTSWRALTGDGIPAFVLQVVVAGLVYLTTWLPWLLTLGGWGRDWGDRNPEDWTVRLFGAPLASLMQYQRQVWDFHTGDGLKHATHPYAADPAGWLVLARPIGIDATNDIAPGTGGCPVGGADCLRVITGIGTPLLWWAGVAALVLALGWWLVRADWRFSVPVVGVAATWLPWFAYDDRPIFFFYAIMIIPFTVIAIALALGRLVGRADEVSPTRRLVGGMIAAVFTALVALNFAWLYPVLSDQLLTREAWQARMWLRSWI